MEQKIIMKYYNWIIQKKGRWSNGDVKRNVHDCFAYRSDSINGIHSVDFENQKSDRDANSRGTMLLLRVQLIEYHDKYMALKEIPSYAYQNFMEMYNAYHALGGNGMVTKMKNEIEELHLKQKERI